MKPSKPPRDVAGRLSPAHGVHIDLGGPNVVFLTVCTKDRAPWIANATVQSTLADIWREKATAWRVGYYLLMPDHLHLFCAPYDFGFSIEKWVKYWKRAYSLQPAGPADEWQLGCFHYRMRNRIEYEEQLWYVQENPVRKKLVETPAKWPFQGRIHDIAWTAD